MINRLLFLCSKSLVLLPKKKIKVKNREREIYKVEVGFRVVEIGLLKCALCGLKVVEFVFKEVV